MGSSLPHAATAQEANALSLENHTSLFDTSGIKAQHPLALTFDVAFPSPAFP